MLRNTTYQNTNTQMPTNLRRSTRLIVLAAGLATAASTASGQSALARIQYEEAEAAFAQNDLGTTVRKLGDAERSLGGTNPPILRLRVLANELTVKRNPNYVFSILESLRRDCEAYNRDYANDNRWIDYTREVLPVCQSLSSYPTTADGLTRARRDALAVAQAAEQERMAGLRREQERRAAEERLQAVRQEMAEHEANAHRSRGRANGFLVLGLLSGGAFFYADSKLNEVSVLSSEYETWEYVSLGSMIVAPISLLVAGFNYLDASWEFGRARELRSQLSVSAGPVRTPGGVAFGLHAAVRF